MSVARTCLEKNISRSDAPKREKLRWKRKTGRRSHSDQDFANQHQAAWSSSLICSSFSDYKEKIVDPPRILSIATYKRFDLDDSGALRRSLM